MNGQLQAETILTSDANVQYKVVSLLGTGGQGEVYHVESAGVHKALKWYKPYCATSEQKAILERLIELGPPDENFLWPEDLIFAQDGKTFGYIMKLRPNNYKSLIDLMKCRVNPSFYSLCRVAYNLAVEYEKLHARGDCYRDISLGNAFFDPDTGDVLICDNDNIAPKDMPCSVSGTPKFMAPEIVLGEARPSRYTDQYSLAVLLFHLFMIGHPLDGQREFDIKCMDMLAMNKLYGREPVFVFDPTNSSNRPVKGWHDNVLIYWNLYPQQLKDLFIESFTTGLSAPHKRVTEKRWMNVIANLMSGITPCPRCGAEVFYDVSKDTAHTCWNCAGAVKMPSTLVIGNSRVLLHKNAKLRSHHISGDYDMDTVMGSVVQNPKNPALWGIRNEGKDNWTYIRTDGTQTPVAPGRSAAITYGAKINFGYKTGEFK